MLQISFQAYTSLLAIKSNVLKLDTAQKVYSAGLFIGVFLATARIHGQVSRCDLSCFSKLC